MKLKRIVIFTIVVCLLFVMPVSASMKSHWLRASGKYHPCWNWAMTSKKVFKEKLSYSNLSKKQKKEALRLFNKDPRTLYKKYRKKIGLDGIFKTKVKGNTLTLWGRIKYIGHGIKKKYKFGKYKFKLSKNIVLAQYGYYGEEEGDERILKGARAKKELKDPIEVGYELFVSNGKLYKIESSP